MPKIPALPPLSSPAADDQIPIEDVSAGATKYISLTTLKTWLQSVASWITTAMISDGQITTPKLNLSGSIGSYGDNVARNYTSSAYVNVTNRAVTATVGPSGAILLSMGGYVSGAPAGLGIFMCAQLSGANSFNTDTSPPTNAQYMRAGTSQSVSFSPENQTKLITGLTPGSTTFQLRYRTAGGGGTVAANNEFIAVVPL